MDSFAITLSKDDEVFNVEVGFKLSREVRNTGATLLCAELSPPISLDDGKVIRFMHFTDFQRFREALSFTVVGLPDVDIKISQDTNIKIIKPVACPQLASLNRELTSTEVEFFAHVFYMNDSRSENLNEAEFLETVQSTWTGLREKVKTILSARRKGPYGISFGIVKVAEKVPALRAMDTVLSPPESFKRGQKVMIILVSSFDTLSFQIGAQVVSIEGLPRIPKDLILRIRAQARGIFNSLQRRAIKVCLNGGIPVHFLGSSRLNVRYTSSQNLKPSHFARIELNLQSFRDRSHDIIEKLRPYIEQLSNHAFTDSSEANLRCLFLDPVINCMFQHGLENQPKGFRLEAEWKTSKLLTETKIVQKIDHTAIIKIGDEEFPIFVLEAGNEPFNLSNPHKDQSKMLAVMNQIGTRMTKAVIAKGKNPEVVRVCGLWIGGLTVQFVVAHPVVTLLSENTYEFHINVSTDPAWIFNLADPSPVVYPTTQLTPEVLERVKPGTLNLATYHLFSGNSSGEVSLNEPSSDSDEDDDVTAALEESLPPRGSKMNYINEEKLKIVNGYVQYCKAQIKAIKDELSNTQTDDRFFSESRFEGLLESGRKSSSSESPPKRRTAERPASNAVASSPLKGITPKKTGFEIYSLKEMLLMLKLTRLSRVFPVIYEFKVVSLTREREVIHYDVEQMEPVFDYQTGSLSRRIISDHPVDTFYGCLRFAIHSIYALNLLHYDFKLIHSSINPRCIVYSEVDDVWKLIDFSDSLDIGESLRTKRIAGFIGYLAPEADKTDIHTPDSDVFALGKVFLNLFDFMILNEILINEDEDQVPREVKAQANLFCNVIQNMIHPDPATRLPLSYILGEVYDILKQYNLFKNDPLYSAIRLLVHENRQMEMFQSHFEGLNLQSAGEQVETIESEKPAGTEMEIEERQVHIPETFTESDPKRLRMEGAGGEKDPEILKNVMQK